VKRAGLGAVETVNVGASRSLRSGRDALGRLLEQAPDVDAIFCSSDLLALGVATEARVRGIHIPDDLALMGFGDVSFAADMAPALSTVRINGAEMGRLAARCLIDRAEGREVSPSVFDLGFSIVERETS
jgi:LacI family transcriptional regulator, gluconate utilization system Gnt-I transcriptional repressor